MGGGSEVDYTTNSPKIKFFSNDLEKFCLIIMKIRFNRAGKPFKIVNGAGNDGKSDNFRCLVGVMLFDKRLKTGKSEGSSFDNNQEFVRLLN